MNAIVETGVRVPSMCLLLIVVSRWAVKMTRCGAQGLEIMRKAIQFAQDVGIRVIQLAGYDVDYQEADDKRVVVSVTA
ncbi:hypothetical protein ACLK1X_23320 [Escherichia coli]